MNFSQPLVSVIIPTYNRYALLKEQVALLQHQTYKNIEFVVIDDGSTDETQNIKEDFPHIHYYRNEINNGFAQSSKKGLEIAEGEYVIFWADDDMILDNSFLEKAIANIKDYDAAFGRSSIKADNYEYFSDYPFKKAYTGKEFLHELQNMRFVFIDHIAFSSFLFKKSSLNNINPFQSIFLNAGSMDISALMKFCFQNHKLVFIDTYVYQWTKTTLDSVSNQKKDDIAFQTMQTISAGLEVYSHTITKDITLLKSVCNDYMIYAYNAILNDYYASKNSVYFERLFNDLNPQMQYYIYCDGWIGKDLAVFLEEKNIKVISFLDDYKKDVLRLDSIKEELLLNEKIGIIIATYKHKDAFKIFMKVQAMGIKNIFVLCNYV